MGQKRENQKLLYTDTMCATGRLVCLILSTSSKLESLDYVPSPEEWSWL